MSAKSRSTFLMLFALLPALIMPSYTFAQQTAEDLVNRGNAEMAKGDWEARRQGDFGFEPHQFSAVSLSLKNRS